MVWKYCGADFYQIGQQSRHTSTCKGVKPFPCHICGENIWHWISLMRHNKSHPKSWCLLKSVCFICQPQTREAYTECSDTIRPPFHNYIFPWPYFNSMLPCTFSYYIAIDLLSVSRILCQGRAYFHEQFLPVFFLWRLKMTMKLSMIGIYPYIIHHFNANMS